jgi:hypothetical protein
MQVRLRTEQWDRALAQLGSKAATKAAVRALNRTGANAKTAMVRVVATDTGLQQKVVRDRIFVGKATGTPPKVTVSADSRPIPLINFKARQTKRSGVKARIPAPGKGTYPNAFIATMKSGHEGVFARNTVTRSRKGMRRGSPALGIHELHGPSIAQSFTRHGTVAEARAVEMIAKNFEAEVKYMLSQATQVGR